MEQVIVSVKDTAAQAYGRPVFVPTVAVAVRSFKEEVNREGSTDDLARHPGDFELYEIGTFDDSTGIVVCHTDASGVPSPRMIARAKDLKESV